MADSFQQRISLEGAEDIIKNLQAIGAEATKAIGQLKTAVTSANPALAALSTTSLAAQNALKGFGAAVSQATTLITPFSASLGGLVTVLGAFAGPAGILAAAGGLIFFARSAADSIVTINRQAESLGLTIQQFQFLSRAAKAAGISNEELVGSLTRVASSVAAQAQDQLKNAVELAKQLASGDIPGVGGGLLSKIIRVEDLNKLKETIRSLGPLLQSVFKEANVKLPVIEFAPGGGFQFGDAILNADQLTTAIFNIAKQSNAAGAAMRKLIADALNMSTAITPFEKFDELLKRNEGGLKALQISFLDSKGNALELFDALQKISAELAKTPAGPRLTALERSIAGRFGPQVLTALKEALGDATKLEAALNKIGISTEAVAEAKKLIAAMNELESSGKKAQQALLLTIGPTITSEIEKLTADIKKLTDPQTILFSIETPAGGFNVTFNELKRTANAVIESIKADFANLGNLISGQFDKVDFSRLLTQIENLNLGSRIGQLIAQGIAAIDWSPAFASLVNTFQNLNFGSLGQRLVLALAQTNWSAAFTSLLSAWDVVVNTIIAAWDRVIQKIREVQSIPTPSLSDTGDVGGGQARGGLIWGPGTGTSDSILARLSRGEFVIRAAAVQHYGPQLMSALNAMRLPRLPGFSLGGLADGLGRTLRANLAIPGMASGGPIPAPARAATVPITLDLRTDRGRFRGSAMADRDVVEALSRFAVLDQITSMGKKSGAY